MRCISLDADGFLAIRCVFLGIGHVHGQLLITHNGILRVVDIPCCIAASSL